MRVSTWNWSLVKGRDPVSLEGRHGDCSDRKGLWKRLNMMMEVVVSVVGGRVLEGVVPAVSCRPCWVVVEYLLLLLKRAIDVHAACSRSNVSIQAVECIDGGIWGGGWEDVVVRLFAGKVGSGHDGRWEDRCLNHNVRWGEGSDWNCIIWRLGPSGLRIRTLELMIQVDNLCQGWRVGIGGGAREGLADAVLLVSAELGSAVLEPNLEVKSTISPLFLWRKIATFSNVLVHCVSILRNLTSEKQSGWERIFGNEFSGVNFLGVSFREICLTTLYRYVYRTVKTFHRFCRYWC
jgi:hypothetical protein